MTIALLMHECSACGTTYATLAESGEKVCPDCGHVDELFDFEDILPVKIASFEEITCLAEAEERFVLWLKGYSEAEGGGDYIVHQVEIKKSLDGWYAIMTQPPQRKGR